MPVLKKIAEIKGYKSYRNYCWDDFSSHLSKNNNETEAELNGGFNTVFGENASGKSAVVQILRSLSQNGGFSDSCPEKAVLVFDKGTYTYENNNWDRCLEKNDIVFFDQAFINANIHTNGNRETAQDKGGHTQNSGKLLIEFDAEALRF